MPRACARLHRAGRSVVQQPTSRAPTKRRCDNLRSRGHINLLSEGHHSSRLCFQIAFGRLRPMPRSAVPFAGALVHNNSHPRPEAPIRAGMDSSQRRNKLESLNNNQRARSAAPSALEGRCLPPECLPAVWFLCFPNCGPGPFCLCHFTPCKGGIGVGLGSLSPLAAQVSRPSATEVHEPPPNTQSQNRVNSWTFAGT